MDRQTYLNDKNFPLQLTFNGLGLMSHKYEIRLKPNAKPHALFTAHYVPIPLREKVQAELQGMQKLEVIT